MEAFRIAMYFFEMLLKKVKDIALKQEKGQWFGYIKEIT
jgi:hypothetical protein